MATDIADKTIDFPDGITAIDTDYVRPRLDASHLLVRGRRAAFVDTGTSHSVPNLLKALASRGIDTAQVDYVFLTHVHLDHAGGAGALLRALPQAKAVVHPRGARHLIDPGKLIAGTKAVYGERAFQELYGEIVPVPAERVIEVADNDVIELDGSVLRFIHTPGHALHHYCIVDADSGSVFSGDTFGISYRIFDTDRGAFIFPATTPTHFDPEQAHASLDRIMSYDPQAVFLTHYSRVTGTGRLAADMHRRVDGFVGIARVCADAGSRRIACVKAAMYRYLLAELEAHGCELDAQTRDTWLAMDIELNAQGLDAWLERVATSR